MAVKYFCDICKKDLESSEVRLVTIDDGLMHHLCDGCLDKIRQVFNSEDIKKSHKPSWMNPKI